MPVIEELKQKIKALEAEIDDIKKQEESTKNDEILVKPFFAPSELNHSLKYYGIMKDKNNSIMVHIPDVDCSYLIKGYKNPLDEIECRLGYVLFNRFASFRTLPKASSKEEIDFKLDNSPSCEAFVNNEDYSIISIDASKEFFTLLGCSDIKLRYAITKEEDGYVAVIDGKSSVQKYPTYADAEKAARMQIFGFTN